MSTLTTNPGAQIDYPSADPQGDPDPLYLGLALSTWVRIATIATLFSLLFWPNLRRIWEKTNPFNGVDPNWAHAMFIPLVGIYYLYVNREKLLATRVQIAWEGLAITLGGILFFAYGIFPGQNDWFKDAGMVVTLFGIVTFLCGWRVMKTAWFPIVFLFCALPWPGLFYSLLASPLQKLAAYVAVHVLNMVGVGSLQSGNKLFIAGKHGVETLNVAEACSGLRSLMTFVSIAAAVAFLSVRPLWQKLVMVASAIPIAIFCNSMRVTVQGIVNHYSNWGTQWSEGFAHGLVGLVMMIPAFFLILLVGWMLEHLFIEEVDDKAALRRKAAAAADARPAAPRPQAIIRKTPAVAKPAADAKSADGAMPTVPSAKTAVTPIATPMPTAPKAPAVTAKIPPSTVKPSAPPARPVAASAPPVAPAAKPIAPTAKQPAASAPLGASPTKQAAPAQATPVAKTAPVAKAAAVAAKAPAPPAAKAAPLAKAASPGVKPAAPVAKPSAAAPKASAGAVPSPNVRPAGAKVPGPAQAPAAQPVAAKPAAANARPAQAAPATAPRTPGAPAAPKAAVPQAAAPRTPAPKAPAPQPPANVQEEKR